MVSPFSATLSVMKPETSRSRLHRYRWPCQTTYPALERHFLQQAQSKVMPHMLHRCWMIDIAHPRGQMFAPTGVTVAAHASLWMSRPNVPAHSLSSPRAKRSIQVGISTAIWGCLMCATTKLSSMSWICGYL